MNNREKNNVKVFLGGTCNGSTWRKHLKRVLLRVEYFDPVVDDWTPECQAEEIRQRKLCDYVLYVITPEMTGVYSIAEAVDDSHKKPGHTIFCIHEADRFGNGFTIGELKSLIAVGDLIENNGGYFADNLQQVADFLNKEVL